jgi:hypothetical protein
MKTWTCLSIPVLVCAACAREVTIPQDDAVPAASVRRDGGTLGSGYRISDGLGLGSGNVTTPTAGGSDETVVTADSTSSRGGLGLGSGH